MASGGSTGGGTTDGTGGGTEGAVGAPNPDGGATAGGGTGDTATAGDFGNTSGWGSLTHALDVLGIRPSATTTVLPMLVGTTTATAMAFAFAIFGKKRRDEEPPAPDEVLQAQAARGDGRCPGSEVGAGFGRRPLPRRWTSRRRCRAGAARRSSRRARPIRPATWPRPPDELRRRSRRSADDGRERRVIRYRVVRLLDAPDELRSAEIGQLDQGDEVQLLERSGVYWLVLCPDGRQGWLHKMTLGEIVTDGAPQGGFASDVDCRRAFGVPDLAARA